MGPTHIMEGSLLYPEFISLKVNLSQNQPPSWHINYHRESFNIAEIYIFLLSCSSGLSLDLRRALLWVLPFRGSCFGPHPITSLLTGQDRGTKVVHSPGAQAPILGHLLVTQVPGIPYPGSCKPVSRAYVGISP